MQIRIEPKPCAELLPFHELYRADANCQLVRDSFWSRGFLDVWAILLDAQPAGYGAVANRHAEGRLLEFHLFPEYRRHALVLCQELLAASGAQEIEAQSNVPHMLHLLNDCAAGVRPERLLFSDAQTTSLPCPAGAIFRSRKSSGELPVFDHRFEPPGDWLIESGGEIVATGGFLTHYNPPWADLYMEVAEPHRRHGIGSYLIQELKRVCYRAGKRPAARCDTANNASRHTLEKAGLLVCGHVLAGRIR